MTIDPNAPAAEDDFNKFFDTLGSLAAEKKPIPADFGAPDAAVKPTPAAVEPVVAAVEPVVATVEPVVAAVEPVVAAADPVAADPAIKPAPVVAPAAEPVVPARSDDTALLSRLADILDKRQPPAAPAAPAAPQRLYTDDEVATLNAFEKDWPDIAKAIGLVMRGQTTANNAQIFKQLGDVLGPQLESIQTVQVDHQLAELRRAIPDYDAVRDPVIQWATTDKSIPPYLRAAYKGVIEGGEVGEINHLVSAWRQATGKVSAPAVTTAPAAKPANELSEAAKQAAASLAPVVSKRTAVVTAGDPTTFDDAWDQYATAKSA